MSEGLRDPDPADGVEAGPPAAELGEPNGCSRMLYSALAGHLSLVLWGVAIEFLGTGGEALTLESLAFSALGWVMVGVPFASGGWFALAVLHAWKPRWIPRSLLLAFLLGACCGPVILLVELAVLGLAAILLAAESAALGMGSLAALYGGVVTMCFSWLGRFGSRLG